MRKASLIIMLSFGLSACGEASLRELRSPGNGPDEFRILPVLPLEQPESFSELPPPTPGLANRTDPNPINDAAVALGGRKGSPNAPIPGADGGIVSYASRAGVDPNIRARLAEEDAGFRKRRSRFTQIRLSPIDRYEQAYKREALDPYPVAEQFRRAGIRVPKAPPR